MGESIQGILSQFQSDGSQRVVKYSNDAENGFQAVVYHKVSPLIVKKDAAVIVEPVSAN